jgi:hypothetical protein
VAKYRRGASERVGIRKLITSLAYFCATDHLIPTALEALAGQFQKRPDGPGANSGPKNASEDVEVAR